MHEKGDMCVPSHISLSVGGRLPTATLIVVAKAPGGSEVVVLWKEVVMVGARSTMKNNDVGTMTDGARE